MNYCIELNVRAKMIQLLKENIGGSFCDLELGNGFLAMTPKAQATTTKKKINSTSSKLKSCVY